MDHERPFPRRKSPPDPANANDNGEQCPISIPGAVEEWENDAYCLMNAIDSFRNLMECRSED